MAKADVRISVYGSTKRDIASRYATLGGLDINAVAEHERKVWSLALATGYTE